MSKGHAWQSKSQTNYYIVRNKILNPNIAGGKKRDFRTPEVRREYEGVQGKYEGSMKGVQVEYEGVRGEYKEVWKVRKFRFFPLEILGI